MRLSASFGLLVDLRYALQAAFLPTLKDVLASPLLLLKPHVVSRIFMSHVWVAFSGPVDEGGSTVKWGLITPNAYGVVLDLGAGHGHSAKYFDTTKVTKYIALEPNTLMHPEIRKAASAVGFTEAAGTLVILGCGAEDIESIFTSTHGKPQEIDTIISILTLCSIPSPRETLASLARDVLKPGGQLLFYEHVLNDRADVAWWQNFWNPFWSRLFDGCSLNRPTHTWINDVGGWRETKVWGKPGEDEENLFIHKVGRFLKADLSQ